MGDTDGDIVYTGKDHLMPLPKGTGFEGGNKPCGAHYRKGSFCRFGDSCKFDHTSINNLGPYSQKAWYAVVRETNDMTFALRVKVGLDAAKLALADKKVAKPTPVTKKAADS